MQDPIITLILQQAARAEGSTQALASRLNAPEPTLLRWMDGRAQTPLRAFLAVLDFLMQLERKAAALQADAPAAPMAPTGQPEKLVFPLGPLRARCERCDGSEFRLLQGTTLRLTSLLGCTACGQEILHGNLLAQLAKDAVQQSRAVAARTKRALNVSQEIVQRGRRRIDDSTRRIGTGGDRD